MKLPSEMTIEEVAGWARHFIEKYSSPQAMTHEARRTALILANQYDAELMWRAAHPGVCRNCGLPYLPYIAEEKNRGE